MKETKPAHAIEVATEVLANVFTRIDRGEPFKSSSRLCADAVESAGIEGARAARVFDVTLGVLRYRDLLDDALRAALTKGKLGFSAPELCLLRAAAYELLVRREDEPAGLVSELVEMAKRISLPARAAPFSKLFNAVARKLSEMPAPEPPAMGAPLEDFSRFYSMPLWYLEKASKQRGENWAKAAASASGERIKHQLRVNPFREPNDSFPLTLNARLIEGAGEDVWETDSLSADVRRANAEGLIVVQTLPSQLAALALDPRPGDSVLDAASGVGVKSSHLCALISGWGDIVLCDKSAEKRKSCIENFARWGIPMPDYLVLDLTDENSVRSAAIEYGGFDAILLDAPCTGSGLIHHMPEKRYTLREKDAAVFGALQTRMLANCLNALNPDGRLVYATCSIWREENEAVTRAALESAGGGFARAESRDFSPCGAHPGFFIEKIVKLA